MEVGIKPGRRYLLLARYRLQSLHDRMHANLTGTRSVKGKGAGGGILFVSLHVFSNDNVKPGAGGCTMGEKKNQKEQSCNYLLAGHSYLPRYLPE